MILTSCGQLQLSQDLDNTAYRSSGIEQFFLPELPAWANASPSGQCFKKHSFQYLDLKKLSKVYQLNYPELLEFQAQYNERLESYFRSTAVRFLKPVEEAAFFSHTLENVRAGVKLFRLPEKDAPIDLIWIDRYIALGQIKEIKKMNESGRFDERVPVIFSSCFSRQDLNQWLIENNLDQVGFYSLTAEWLTPFGPDLEMKSGLQIEIKKMIGKDADVRFIGPTENLKPTEIVL